MNTGDVSCVTVKQQEQYSKKTLKRNNCARFEGQKQRKKKKKKAKMHHTLKAFHYILDWYMLSFHSVRVLCSFYFQDNTESLLSFAFPCCPVSYLRAVSVSST